jgi:multidrug efflux system membrane fusion protein
MFSLPRKAVSASVLIALVTLAACTKQAAPAAAASQGPAAVPVTVATATQETIPFEIRVVGTADASATVQVKSQVAGQILKVHFTEGENVAKDALLFEIDSRSYRESLRQAEAALARDRAQLRQAEATLARDTAQSKNAEAESARYADLSKSGVVSRSQTEQVRTNADVYHESVRGSQAAIESARAAIQSDQAAIEKVKLDIAYCEVRAPIAGRTGNRLVDAGNLVSANGTSALVTIHQVTPMNVLFSVPEQHLPAIRRISAIRSLPVRVYVKDDPTHTATGKLTVIDNAVDSTTGTIRLKAVFENRDGILWPGQFVNVVLLLDAIQNATVIPGVAVQVGQKSQFVYVVKNGQTVEPRTVTTGRDVGGRMIIETGLSPGEIVVTDGHLRLTPGSRVKVLPSNAVPELKL